MGFVKRGMADNPPQEGDRRAVERDFSGLCSQLNSPEPSVRRWAARDLAQYREASAALLERLKCEENKEVREAIFSSLISIADGVALEGLAACLRSEDAALRNEAIETLQEMPEKAARTVKALLKDEDPDVRIFAINVLQSFKHPEVEDWLIEAVESEEHINVCATAVDLLAEIGTERAIEPLERLKERFSREPYIEFAVDTAIRRIRGGKQ